MVDFIQFFRLFNFSTYGGGSRWSILLIFFDFSTFRPGAEGLDGRFYSVFSTFRLFDLGGGSRWSILFNFFDFSTFRPGGEGLDGRFF